MVNSKVKGATFERKVASLFKEYGYNARRGQQYSGLNGDADVVDVPYLSIECKAREKMSLYEWMEQAKRDSEKNGRIPTVIHKKNHCDVLVTMRFSDWISLYKAYELERSLYDGIS